MATSTCNISPHVAPPKTCQMDDGCIHTVRPSELDPRGARKVKLCCTVPRSNEMHLQYIPSFLNSGRGSPSPCTSEEQSPLFGHNVVRRAVCVGARGVPVHLPEAWNTKPRREMEMGLGWPVGELEGRPHDDPQPRLFFLVGKWGCRFGARGTSLQLVVSSKLLPSKWSI